MDYTCHECGEPQSVWMVARCSNPNKSVSCSEAFCFKCLGQTYPQLYNNIFKGLWWICPSCTGLCKCETCSDPVKKAEYNRLAKRKLNQRASKPAPVEEIKTLKLRSGTVHNKVSRMIPEAPVVPEEPENWICSRCSSSNSLDDIECIACGCHRKRNTRKRISQEPVHEDKFHAMKETRKATENNEDKAAPVKGRVSALRQLVKKPWADGWEQARTLALDLIEEAKLIALKQGIPLEQARQLPTKYHLANIRATHARKWFDREPTLAKKFLRAANFVHSKSNGTFLMEHIRSIEDLPFLIRQVETSKLSEKGDGENDDVIDDDDGAATVPDSPKASCSPLPFNLLQVYFHPIESSCSPSLSPTLLNVPVGNLTNMNDFLLRLNAALADIGADVKERKLMLRDSDNAKLVDAQFDPANLSRFSALHLHLA